MMRDLARAFCYHCAVACGPKHQAIVEEDVKVKKEGVDEERNKNVFPPGMVLLDEEAFQLQCECER